MRKVDYPPVFWFTGLSGAGKTTLAVNLRDILAREGLVASVLDGDEMRKGLCNNLGFTMEDRRENIRRIAECAKIMSHSGIVCCVACITPLLAHRRLARQILSNRYVEIFVSCAIDECKKRDVKGLYARVDSGKLKNFTGLSSPYETPDNPDIVISTDNNSLAYCIESLSVFAKKYLTGKIVN